MTVGLDRKPFRSVFNLGPKYPIFSDPDLARWGSEITFDLLLWIYTPGFGVLSVFCQFKVTDQGDLAGSEQMN